MSLARLAVAAMIFFAGLLILSQSMHQPHLTKELTVWTLIITGPYMIAFCTERDGKAERSNFPSQREDSTVGLNSMNGGARGLVFLLASLLWLFACNWLSHSIAGATSKAPARSHLWQVAMVCMYSWIYVSLPSTLLANKRFDQLPIWARRLGLVALVVTSWAVSGALGDRGMVLVPFRFVEEVRRHGGFAPESELAAWYLVAAFVVSLVIALPRMLRAARQSV